MSPPNLFIYRRNGRFKMSKNRSGRFAALKIFIASFLISVGVSVIAELFLSDMGLVVAVIVVLILIFLGIFFDIVGVAFTSCDQKPFIAMSSRKIKRATHALKLLKNAEIVANICNDVIGDICNIVSGAAGAAIVVKVVTTSNSTLEFILGIAISSIIASFTVAGKTLGKGYAIKNNIKIVEACGSIAAFFKGDRQDKK